MAAGVIRHSDGTAIAYDVAGDGPAVVFLHGMANRRQAWDPVTALLASSFMCVRLDFRGHGESSAAPDYGMASLVSDVRAVIEELSLGAPALVGHSLGGSVAAVYAAGHDARAVVCVDQSLRFGEFAERIQPLARQLRGERTMEAVMEFERGLQIEPYPVADLERRIIAFAPEVVLGIWAAALDTPPRQLTELSEALLPQITGPLLCLHGSSVPEDYPAWLAALAPSALVEVWDGAGHMLHLVDPERFAARVTEFLER